MNFSSIKRAVVPTNSLYVAIHDVHEDSYSNVVPIRERLYEVGIKHVTFLTVPYFHSKKNILDAKDLVSYLKARLQCGDDIAMHGCCHLCKSKDFGLLKRIVHTIPQKILSNFEGEFFGLTSVQVAEKLTFGAFLLRGAGLETRNFVAPAWMLSKEGWSVVKNLGFNVLMSYSWIVNLNLNLMFHSRVISGSTRTFLRRSFSKVYVRSRFAMHKGGLLRVEFHPNDILDTDYFNSVLFMLETYKHYRQLTMQSFSDNDYLQMI